MAALDRVNYFQLLRLAVPTEMADIPSDLRKAYRKQARLFHPDRYRAYGNVQLNANLEVISKRIREAYMVMRNPEMYACYLLDLLEEGKLRFDETSEKKMRTKKLEVHGTSPEGQRYISSAMKAKSSGDLKTALKAIKMALVYEPTNAPIKQLAGEWAEQLTKQVS